MVDVKMANTLKLIFLLLLIFFLMNNAKGTKPVTEEGIVHSKSLFNETPYNFVSHKQ